MRSEVASTWLTTAKLARKGNQTHTAFNAVLHATQLGEDAAKIEHSRLLWKDGQPRKAIQNLRGAITANAFRSNKGLAGADSINVTTEPDTHQNLLTAKAFLLHAKWLDMAGQTASIPLRDRYQEAVN